MQNLSIDRLRKQDLLLMEVRFGGLNPNSFVEYLREIKGDQYNQLDSWDYVELARAIESYQTQLQVGYEAPRSQIGVMQSSIRKTSNFTLSRNMQDQFYRKVVECKEAQPNSISSYFSENPGHVLEAKIIDYKIIDEGVFTPNYVKFKVDVPEFGWSVQRRFNDFAWLRQILISQYPDQLVPPLPKKTIVRKFDPKHLSKRIRMLELFLSTIINSPQLRSSKCVVDFLSLEETKMQALSESKDYYQSLAEMQSPQRFEDYTTLDGKVVLEINPFLNRYYSNITSYLELTNDLYKKTTDSSRYLFESLEDSQQKMTGLESNIRNIKDLTDHFNQQNPIGNFGVLSITYTMLEGYLRHWHKNMDDMLRSYKQGFYEFFRFQREMQDQCLDMVNLRNKYEGIFYKREKDLDQKREKYYRHHPVEKWELNGDYDHMELMNDKKLAFSKMFPKDQKQLEENKDQFAYLNKQLIENFTSYFDNKGVLYTKRSLEMMQKMQEHLQLFNTNLDVVVTQLGDVLTLRGGTACESLQSEWQMRYLNSLTITHAIGLST